MPDLSEILNKAYLYTKNHRFLWFFGFFLTGWGMMNFIRHVDWDPAKELIELHHLAHLAEHHPSLFYIGVLGLFLVLVGLSILGAVSRSLIIYTALHTERREHVTLKMALKGTVTRYWRVFWVGVLTGLTMLFILSWLAVPLYFVFRSGADIRAILFALFALLIFIPIIVILSLVNIFSACYIVVYDLKIMQSIKGSFDLVAGFWERTISLFMILFFIYCGLVFFSATLTGLVSYVAYHIFILMKALPASIIFDILVVVTSLLVISINSILNVFTNLAWTLFFLKIVKVKFIEEGAVIAQSVT